MLIKSDAMAPGALLWVAWMNLRMGAMASESPFNIPFTSELLRDAIAVMSWGASIYHTGLSQAERSHFCPLT